LGILAFFWLVVARILTRFGGGAPCPYELSWVVDNPLRRHYMGRVLERIASKDRITMITRVKKRQHWIALAGIASLTYWLWRRSHSPYWHHFTDFTDTLVSPYNLGFSIYNWVFNVLGGHKHEAFRQRVIELADLQGDERVLDVGCGTGLTTLRIAEQNADCVVHGIDLSPKMIEASQKDTAECGLAVDLRENHIVVPHPKIDSLADCGKPAPA
jgi:2-polyprenyl-3-methyl-5-hydroxy-6-metoxy-1,4-benzoquinol methylase